jgi:hypothetical protein
MVDETIRRGRNTLSALAAIDSKESAVIDSNRIPLHG